MLHNSSLRNPSLRNPSLRHPRTRRFRVRHAAIVVMIVGLVSSALGASPAVAIDDTTTSPKHAWVDPTVPLSGGNFGFSVTFTFPPITEHAVSHGTAPVFTTGVTHCLAGAPVSPMTFSCEGLGTPVPGEYTFEASIRTLAGDIHHWVVPVTVCDGACSPRFWFTASPEPLRYLVNEELGTQTQGTYVFNEDWNANSDTVVFSPPSNSNGFAPGDWEITTAEVMNGSHYGLRGTFSATGDYAMTIQVQDEFGGLHAATQSIHVCTREECPDLVPGYLPDTGQNLILIYWIGGISALVIVLGVGAMIIVRRRGKK